MHPNTQVCYIIRVVIINRKVINCNWFIQFYKFYLFNCQVASIGLLEVIAHFKFICIDPTFIFNPKWMIVCCLNNLFSNRQYNYIITLISV